MTEGAPTAGRPDERDGHHWDVVPSAPVPEGGIAPYQPPARTTADPVTLTLRAQPTFIIGFVASLVLGPLFLAACLNFPTPAPGPLWLLSALVLVTAVATAPAALAHAQVRVDSEGLHITGRRRTTAFGFADVTSIVLRRRSLWPGNRGYDISTLTVHPEPGRVVDAPGRPTDQPFDVRLGTLNTKRLDEALVRFARRIYSVER